MITGRKKKTKSRAKTPAKKSSASKSATRNSATVKLEALLDSELEDTFPASDPLELTAPGSTSKPPRKRR